MNILPDLVLPSRINCNWTESGMDSYENCINKQHFIDYPHEVIYNYNSRGFRDKEWPAELVELKKSIWCIGDSFTVGLGSPAEHTWPYVLEKATNLNTINVSLDGASNNWIARRAVDIINQICPNTIVVMWSFLHRRESSDTSLNDEKRKLQFSDKICNYADIDNFKLCYDKITNAAKNKTKVIHSIIPGASPISDLEVGWQRLKDISWPELPPMTYYDFESLDLYIQEEIKSVHKEWYDIFLLKQYTDKNFPMFTSIINIEQKDYSRDGFHFDICHSKHLVKEFLFFI